MEQKKRKLPMWLTALLVLLGALAGIALIILTVVSIAAVEGFATLIFLIVNILIFIVWPLRHKTKANLNGALGIAFIFMAFMGAVIDQAGNPVFNKPVGWCMCEQGESFTRGVTVSEVGTKTIYQQDFRCHKVPTDAGKPVSMFAVIGIRFVEYIALILFLVLIQRQIWQWRFGRNTP